MAERKLNSTNFHNQTFLEDKCALNELINLLSKRWMTDVLFSIEEGNIRFSSLKERLQHISDHILADRLKFLEQHELISKQYAPGNPPRAEYSLTNLGMELSSSLNGLCDFAENKMHSLGKKLLIK
jgi:DNA-binding HxlR family transcriptional regulator